MTFIHSSERRNRAATNTMPNYEGDHVKFPGEQDVALVNLMYKTSKSPFSSFVEIFKFKRRQSVAGKFVKVIYA